METRRREYYLGVGIYNRSRMATSLTTESCDGCGEHKVCLCTDGSDGEYSSVLLCRDCIDKIIRQEDLTR